MNTPTPAARQRKPKIEYSPGQFGEISDVAAILRASRATVYRLISNGQLPRPRQIGGRALFAPPDMAAILSGEAFKAASAIGGADDDV